MLYNTDGARTKDACTREAERDNRKTRCTRNEGRNDVFVAIGWGRGRWRDGRAHMSAEFEIGILNSRHFCFDVSRVVIRSVGVYQRPGTRK